MLLGFIGDHKVFYLKLGPILDGGTRLITYDAYNHNKLF